MTVIDRAILLMTRREADADVHAEIQSEVVRRLRWARFVAMLHYARSLRVRR